MKDKACMHDPKIRQVIYILESISKDAMYNISIDKDTSGVSLISRGDGYATPSVYGHETTSITISITNKVDVRP